VQPSRRVYFSEPVFLSSTEVAEVAGVIGREREIKWGMGKSYSAPMTNDQ
jgi:hypothetical protein